MSAILEHTRGYQKVLQRIFYTSQTYMDFTFIAFLSQLVPTVHQFLYPIVLILKLFCCLSSKWRPRRPKTCFCPPCFLLLSHKNSGMIAVRLSQRQDWKKQWTLRLQLLLWIIKIVIEPFSRPSFLYSQLLNEIQRRISVLRFSILR